MLVFVLLGIALETLHAVKYPGYLDVGRETTRLLLRLAHAHGTLLSLVNVMYALTIRAHPETSSRGASIALALSLLLLPLGFFLGALSARSGDPGLGVLLVPPGAVLLSIAAALVARRT